MDPILEPISGRKPWKCMNMCKHAKKIFNLGGPGGVPEASWGVLEASWGLLTAQRRPKRLQDSPRGAQDSPGGAHDGPRGAQDGPEGAQDSPRGAQKAPKRLPKRPRDPPREPPRGPPGPSQNDLGTRPLKITKIIEKQMVFQHFWAPDPTPHRPPNRVVFQPAVQNEKK